MTSPATSNTLFVFLSLLDAWLAKAVCAYRCCQALTHLGCETTSIANEVTLIVTVLLIFVIFRVLFYYHQHNNNNSNISD